MSELSLFCSFWPMQASSSGCDFYSRAPGNQPYHWPGCSRQSLPERRSYRRCAASTKLPGTGDRFPCYGGLGSLTHRSKPTTASSSCMEEASPYGFMLCAEVKKQASGGVVHVEGIHKLARLKQSTQTEFFSSSGLWRIVIFDKSHLHGAASVAVIVLTCLLLLVVVATGAGLLPKGGASSCCRPSVHPFVFVGCFRGG